MGMLNTTTFLTHPNRSSTNGHKGAGADAVHDHDLLAVGDFRIDLDRRTVLLREKSIELAPEEFDLLVFLVSNPKKMVTSRTMLSTHWNGGHVHQAKFLQVLLSLRRKLEAVVDGHYIRTEPLVVYRFDPLG